MLPPTRCTIAAMAAAALALALSACREQGSGAAAGASSGSSSARGVATSPPPRGIVTAPPPASPAATPGSRPAQEEEPAEGAEGLDCAPPGVDLKPLQLLRFTFAPAVENRDPAGKLNVARPGQRVWAHLRIRNRSGRDRCVKLVFRVNGDERTELRLEVGESWNWRTWGYVTLRPTDTSGAVELSVVDDQGNLVTRQRLPIVPEPRR